ncbi:methyltransferase domain-containing protein [Treponema sp. HNW]|uniref:cytidylyltransferase domain-containing protein n=1 Tax=Treponema sp. HNW TaxID=3116654 RepID=UPI003D114CBA
MTAVIVQCRLASSRLPKKALLPLGSTGKPLFLCTLDAMKKVKADTYWLACDAASYDVLAPLCEQNGWNCFGGSENDVLSRFCGIIEKTGASRIIRATADNPFLCYEAARASIDGYKKRGCDYFTFSGLPHGSGVEVLSARALLHAHARTTDAFEREHVGPALYNHKDVYTCIFEQAPAQWNMPHLRTTVDTPADYRRAQRICRFLEDSAESASAAVPPFAFSHILRALEDKRVHSPVLAVPAVGEGRGTGHLRRCLSLCQSAFSQGGLSVDLLIDEKASDAARSLIDEALSLKKIQPVHILNEIPEAGEYALILTDSFRLEKKKGERLFSLAPVVSFDEGPYPADIDWSDYLVDIIPPLYKKRLLNLNAPCLIPLPPDRFARFKIEKGQDGKEHNNIQSVLLCIGGEDPASLSRPALKALADYAPLCEKRGFTLRVCAVLPPQVREAVQNIPFPSSFSLCASVPNLFSEIHTYDLVITHYGFTAFEAAVSGCALLLLATTSLHKKLAQKYGSPCLSKKDLKASVIDRLCSKPDRLIPEKLRTALSVKEKRAAPLSLVENLVSAERYGCPLCSGAVLHSGSVSHSGVKSCRPDKVIARDPIKTIRRCKRCGMPYIGFLSDTEKKYEASYFFEEYKKQYGKTYLEDFESIKAQGLRRIALIDKITGKKTDGQKRLLDIGCAYGAFLSAASDSRWAASGTDICSDAVSYVQNTLGFQAQTSVFPDFSSKTAFDAVTMWFVIEHFSNLDAVLRKVSELTKPGGIFAFSTPSASGVSARFSKKRFFRQSPADHFTLWEIKRCRRILRTYGFKVCKIVSTGHHPERFPFFKIDSHNRFALFLSKLFLLGDTFEVYCKKTEGSIRGTI